MIRDFFLFFKELYINKKLLLKFSYNDFKAKYAGSFLGVFWAFINPLVTIGVYWFVFDKGLKAGMTDGNIPFILYLTTGIIAWFFFSDTLMSATNCFREYSYLVKKVVFSIKILPTAKMLSSLYTHIFFIIIAFVLTAIYGFYPSLYSFQIIYYLFGLIMFLTGLTWITASIQPFFSDITQLINVVMQVLMWGTPILWDIKQFPPEYSVVFKLNPLFYIVQGYRDALLGKGWIWDHWNLTIYFWCFTIFLMLVGSVVYNKLKPHFSDVL